MQICNRVIFDKPTGVIFYQTGEHQGEVTPHPNVTEIDFIDIPFGSIDYNTHYIDSIDEEGNPVIMSYDNPESEEQRKIRELEDALLIQTENEVGGIL